MQKLLLSCLLTAAAFAASAQEPRPTYVINPGETLRGKLTNADVYKYANFGPGTVYFKNGAATNAPLNYNFVLAAIQFIDPKGDTLTLGNEDQIDLITVGNDSFYHNKVYLQLAGRMGDGTSIYRKEFMRLASVRKIGLFDQPVEGGSAESFSSFWSNSTVEDKSLALRQRLTLVRETFLYITDKYEHLVLVASRRNFEKIYPKKKSAIGEYLAANKVDFQSLNDVQALMVYLQDHS
ncbi:hypothetical protein [Flaviaesturariibacter aridisoli]|uniref:DUF4369 domain-containing protein n=1 Tax=Flaviaesturariibacter aridisoli TaxID=2545761 RepID=A0A4R4E6A6_9BACT|nr:hypothetical protein [Flaviaesturariibacter aridisoli]TCZ75029.1 hypothetical protein E0486_01615 [Flaviaesturariibacter aridisoli]